MKKLIIAFERNLHKKNLHDWISEIGFGFPTCSTVCSVSLFLQLGTLVKQGWVFFGFQMRWKLPILLSESLGGGGILLFLKQSRSVWGLEWQSWRVKSSLWTGMIFLNFFWKSSSDFLLYLSTEMVGWCFITHYVGWTWGEPISALHWDTLLVGTAKLQTYVMDQATLTCKAQPRETDTACLGLL